MPDLQSRRRAWLTAANGRSYEEWRCGSGCWHSVLTDTEAHPGVYRGDKFDADEALTLALERAEAAEQGRSHAAAE